MGFWVWLSWRRNRFASVDYYACWAFVEGVFGVLGRLIFQIVYSGEVVFDSEQVGLFCTKSAADAADFAHFAGALAGFLAATCDGHHGFMAKGDHLDEIAWAGFRAGCTAGALIVIDGSQPIDNMKGVEFAGVAAVAEAQAAKLAGLGVWQGVGARAALQVLIFCPIGFVGGVCPAMHDGFFGGS